MSSDPEDIYEEVEQARNRLDQAVRRSNRRIDQYVAGEPRKEYAERELVVASRELEKAAETVQNSITMGEAKKESGSREDEWLVDLAGLAKEFENYEMTVLRYLGVTQGFDDTDYSSVEECLEEEGVELPPGIPESDFGGEVLE